MNGKLNEQDESRDFVVIFLTYIMKVDNIIYSNIVLNISAIGRIHLITQINFTNTYLQGVR